MSWVLVVFPLDGDLYVLHFSWRHPLQRNTYGSEMNHEYVKLDMWFVSVHDIPKSRVDRVDISLWCVMYECAHQYVYDSTCVRQKIRNEIKWDFAPRCLIKYHSSLLHTMKTDVWVIIGHEYVLFVDMEVDQNIHRRRLNAEIDRYFWIVRSSVTEIFANVIHFVNTYIAQSRAQYHAYKIALNNVSLHLFSYVIDNLDLLDSTSRASRSDSSTVTFK